MPLELFPGILWLRLPLPYRLDHVNAFLIEDGDGWALLDAGQADAATEAIWLTLCESVLDRPLTRLIVTHFHPDHIGMAGWFTERFDVPLHMTQTEYLSSQAVFLDPGQLQRAPYLDFYRRHGLDPDTTWRLTSRSQSYRQIVRSLPPTFQSLHDGDELRIGRRLFRVLTGAGHSPEQVMLYCAADNLLFSADQILNRISPNVGVWAVDPDDDVLGRYLSSLHAIAATVPDDVLVLPGHDLAFYGLHKRIAELTHHHETRCGMLLDACRLVAKTAAELMPSIFSADLGTDQKSFAFGEVLAHINYLRRRDLLRSATGDDGLVRFIAA